VIRSLIVWTLVVIAVPLALVRPFFGILAYLGFSHSRIADFVWTGYSVENYGLFIACTTLVGYGVLEIRKSPPRIRGLKGLFAFWLWLVLSSLFAYNVSLAYSKVWQYSTILLITCLIAAMGNSENRIKNLLLTLGGSLGFLGVKGAIDLVLTGGKFRMEGPGGMTADTNEYALAMGLGLVILLGLAPSQQGLKKWLLRMSGVCCGMVVIGTRSRSGLLGLVLALVLLTLYSRRKLIGMVGLTLATIAFLLFAPSGSIDRYKTIQGAEENDPSAMARIAVWHAATKMIKARPIFGVGLRNFELAMPLYSSLEPRAPHNAFIALASEAGLPSCLLFLNFILGASLRMFMLRRRLRRYEHLQNLATYCKVIHIALIVYLVPNCFINRQDMDLMYHLVGVGAGLGIVAEIELYKLRRRTAEETEEIEEEGEDEEHLLEGVAPA